MSAYTTSAFIQFIFYFFEVSSIIKQAGQRVPGFLNQIWNQMHVCACVNALESTNK